MNRRGTWSPLALWVLEPDQGQAAAELEELGYGAIWLGNGAEIFDVAESLLAATKTITVATGIVNIWTHPDPAAVATRFRTLADKYPDRLLLGLGSGPRTKEQAARSAYRALITYLDELNRLGVGPAEMLLGALGQSLLALSVTRSAGALPFLTTPEHTRQARETLGDAPLLAIEQHLVVDADVERARAIAREDLEFYLPKASYRRNLLRLGFTEDDLSGTGSDRLVDSVVPHGDAKAVLAQINGHFSSGADHVAIQPITSATLLGRENRRLPMEQFRELARAWRCGCSAR